jgi:lysophospholipase L1-like esterase
VRSLTAPEGACFLRRVASVPARRRLVRPALGLVASAAIFVVAGELITRQLGVIDRLNGLPRRLFLATTIPDLPYRLRPGVEVRVRHFTVRVNRLGLRGPETTPRPAPGRRRILALGDSVVYGEGLDEADTFPVLLERELAAAAGDVPAPEVLNGAAPGYNTEVEAAFLREIGLGLAPDALLLGVSLNDFGDAPGLTPFGFLTVEREARARAPWLSNHSEFYRLVRWLATYARGGHWYQRVARYARPPAPGEDRWAAIDRALAGMHKRFYAAPSGPGWERVRRALVDVRDTARARGMELTVVVFPEKDQVEEHPPNLDPQRAWLALCAELDVRCLDLWPAFAAAAASGPLFADTQHPNAAGMRVAARATAELLRR